jgi:hypothetical protein
MPREIFFKKPRRLNDNFCAPSFGASAGFLNLRSRIFF